VAGYGGQLRGPRLRKAHFAAASPAWGITLSHGRQAASAMNPSRAGNHPIVHSVRSVRRLERRSTTFVDSKDGRHRRS
jgi:hypothetical protein